MRTATIATERQSADSVQHPLSITGRKPPHSGTANALTTDGVGIDTIKVGGPLTNRPDLSAFQTNTTHGYGGDRFASTGWTILDGIKVVASTNHYGRGAYSFWESSLPTAEHGHNLYAMPLPEALDHLRRTYDRTAELVKWAVPFDELEILKLDTDRDFVGVDDIPGLLAALSQLPVPRASKGFAYWTKEGDHSLGFTVRRRWKGQLYDKERQLSDRLKEIMPVERPAVEKAITAAKGTLRFEARTMRRVNRELNIATLAELTPEIVESINRQIFERCHFGQDVGSRSKLRELIEGSFKDSTAGEMGKIIGMLFLEKEGFLSPFSHNPTSHYRRRAKELGISTADLVNEGDSSYQLDYDKGILLSNEEHEPIYEAEEIAMPSHSFSAISLAIRDYQGEEAGDAYLSEYGLTRDTWPAYVDKQYREAFRKALSDALLGRHDDGSESSANLITMTAKTGVDQEARTTVAA
jgi:hypothetical protein